jgi:hypothetical protein
VRCCGRCPDQGESPRSRRGRIRRPGRCPARWRTGRRREAKSPAWARWDRCTPRGVAATSIKGRFIVQRSGRVLTTATLSISMSPSLSEYSGKMAVPWSIRQRSWQLAIPVRSCHPLPHATESAPRGHHSTNDSIPARGFRAKLQDMRRSLSVLAHGGKPPPKTS